MGIVGLTVTFMILIAGLTVIAVLILGAIATLNFGSNK